MTTQTDNPIQATRIDASVVRPFAESLCRALLPVCSHAEIAGSLRRGGAAVHDIEVVVCPVFDTDLFGNDPAAGCDTHGYSALEAVLTDWTRRGLWALDEKCQGRRMKRFRGKLHKGEFAEIAVELYLTDAGNFGNILAIRTGSAPFSRALVTARKFGGLLPNDLTQAGGYLWRGTERLACPTEQAFFDTLGLPVPPPSARDAEMATRLQARIMAGWEARESATETRERAQEAA